MGVGTQISETEYLHTSCEPDCEYADGALIERNVGTTDHSWLRTAPGAYFFRRRKLCVVAGERPQEPELTSPPLVWIEILSPEDRPIRINQKVREILDFGVPSVWVIDPQTLESELHTPSGSRTREDGTLRVEGTAIEVPLRELEND